MVVNLTAEELNRKLLEIFEQWPLYRELSYTGGGGVFGPPRYLSLYCPSCKKDQFWQALEITQNYDYRRGFQACSSKCRNCGSAQTDYFYYWAKVEGETPGVWVFFKAGQYPPVEEWVPPALERQLAGEDLEFYKKALRCRNFNYGIAALAYLRRVV